MSLLSGIISGVRTTYNFISGDSYGATLVKTIALAYGLKELSDSVNKDNNAAPNNIDKGVRLQVPPANDNKIPVLYGSAYFGGIISDAEMTSDNKTMYYVLTLSERTGNKLSDGTTTNYTFNDVYWNDQRVVFRSDGITVDYSVDKQGNIDRSLSGYVEIYHYAGNSSSGQAPDGYTATVPNAADVMPSWAPATHTMSDLIFAVVKVNYNRERNITGIGDLKFKVTSDTMLPGDCLYDYMTNEMYGAGIEASKLNQTHLGDLNTYSAQSVTYIDAATGTATLPNRYQINGLLDTSEKVLTNAEKIASAAATWISYDIHSGQWTFVINRASNSVASFDDSNILSNISLQGTGIRELYNKVKVEFPHRDLRDSADYRGIAIPVADRNANEVSNQLGISYDIINEPVQAEILGLIELKQTRIDVMVQFQTDYSYISLNAGDVIDLTNARFGYTNKPFRIVTVEEQQDDAGALVVDILAVAYDADVYDVSDLTRYVRSDEDGIITIGSIGTPGQPTVTKFQQSSRPRIVVSTTTPSGIVDGLEYWLSNDVTLDEENRSYRLVGERRPSEAETFPSGTPVDLTLDSLPSSDFVIKVRAFNSLTVSPYTNPTGLVEYRPVQTTDAITPDTTVLDQLGNVAIALTAIDLLKGLDDLYQGLTGNESVFDVIFDKFEEVTGVDLVGQASGGTLVVEADLATLDNGTLIESKTNSYNFIATGGTITSDVDGNITIDLGEGVRVSDPAVDTYPVWNGVEWVAVPTCCETQWPPGKSPDEVDPPDPPEPPGPCFLPVVSQRPANAYNWDWADARMGPPLVPHIGSLFIKYDVGPESPSSAFYSEIIKNTGAIELYSTDGQLIESLDASACIVRVDQIEIPFSNRVLGEDYYVLMAEGCFEYCGCISPAFDDPTYWSFTTAPYTVNSYQPGPVTQLATFEPSHNSLPQFSVLTYTVSPTASNLCKGDVEIVITFSEPVEFTGPSVELRNANTGVLVDQWDGGPGVFEGTELTLILSVTLDYDTEYEIIVPLGAFQTVRDPVNVGVCDVDYFFASPQARNLESTTQFGTDFQFALIDYQLVTYPFDTQDKTQVNIRSNIALEFNKTFTVNSTNSFVYLHRASDDVLIQTFDLNADFVSNKVGLLDKSDGSTLFLNPTEIMEPGTDYYLNTSADFVLDKCSEGIPAIIDKTTITWRTDEIVQTSEERTTPQQQNQISFVLDRPVVPGPGKLNVYDEQDNLVAQIDSNDPAITYK